MYISKSFVLQEIPAETGGSMLLWALVLESDFPGWKSRGKPEIMLYLVMALNQTVVSGEAKRN